MRAFIALPLPEYIRHNIRKLQLELEKVSSAEKVSWPDYSGCHITVAFLGEIPEGGVCKIIREGITDSLDGEGPFKLNLCIRGVFPSLRSPRVMWVGPSRAEALKALKSRVDAALEKKTGIIPEKREYFPHVTIGRIRTSGGAPSTVRAFLRDDAGIGSFNADSVELIESRFTSGRVKYRTIEKVRF